MGTFGITDFDSSNALCKDGTIDKNNPSNPCVNNGGVNWGGGAKSNIDWKEISKNVLNNQGFPNTYNVTSTPVLCKDGTTKNQLSSPTGKYADACMNNGGRAEKQPVVNAPALPTKGKESLLKKISGAYNKNLIVAVILVAGYFAYKKFKK